MRRYALSIETPRVGVAGRWGTGQTRGGFDLRNGAKMSYWTQFPRDRINRRQLLTLGALGASAGFLAACGGKNAGPSNQATAVASPIVTRSNPRLEVPDPKIQV